MKFNWMLRGVSIMLTAIFSTVSLYAVIAKPGIVNLRQSDGTTLQARIIGDEFFHTYLTPDGYPLVFDNGSYKYARVDDGNLVSTGVRAVNKELRPESHVRLLTDIEPSTVEKYFDTSYALAKQSTEVRKAPKGVVSGDRSRYMISNFPNYGKQKGLVILVEYNDVKFTLDDPYDYFSRLLNEPGFSDLGATGSARDYFIESSHGQFLPDFDVFGPVTLPEDRSYYGSNTGGYNDAFAWKMVTTAAEYLDDIIDFSQYDRDNDGYVDNIYIFYAGEGESGGGGYETVWPHAAQIAIIDKKNRHIHDGKIIDHYACSNEMDFEKPDGVGTFCHEFSHVMGLPDFYATGYQNSFTPGALSLLDSGSYNNESRTPPLYSAFERYCVGWLDLEVIEGKDNIVLPPIGSNKAYAIETGNPDEFYILENRQKISWDSKMPAHGMLVWHVDYDKEAWSTNSVNNDPQHQRLDVVEADDLRDYDSYDGDTFPGVRGVTSFTDDTTPSMKTWDGKRLSMPITDIKESEDGFISFKICGGNGDTEAPATPVIAINGSQTATIEWEAVDGATDYLVTIFTPENFFLLQGYDRKSSGGKTKLEVSGLMPETSYGCYVQAVTPQSASNPSPIAHFKTEEMSFRDLKVTALDAEEISESSFTARWEALEGATDYRITVFECSEGEPEKLTVDFTGGINGLPAGWLSTSTAVYNMAAYAGEAVPSLRMTTTGDKLVSAEFADGISAVSFWHRGNGSSTASNKILVEGRDGEQWIELASLPVVTAQGGHTEAITNIPDGIIAIRFSYIGESKGSLAVDDVVISHGHSLVTTPLEGYISAETGNTTEFKVENIAAGADYCYEVAALDADGNISRSSERIFVSTPAPAGLEDIMVSQTSTGETRVYDPAGRIVATGDNLEILNRLNPGIYIISSNGKTSKIIIKHKQ